MLKVRTRSQITCPLQAPIHPSSLCCQAVEYSRYAPFWRLASWAPRHPETDDLFVSGPLVTDVLGATELI